MPDLDQPEEQFRVHNGVHMPLVQLYVKDADFPDDEEQQFHHHFGEDVPVKVVYAECSGCHDAMEAVGVSCPVCGLTPNEAFNEYRLQAIMDMHHFEEHGD